MTGWIISAVLLPAALLLAGGCATNTTQARGQLDVGEIALRSAQYDAAIRAADNIITMGAPSDLAEAYYLRGKAIEERPKADTAATLADLTAARRDYTASLNQNPTRQLEGLIHGQLGNVCYFQEDYATALQQWNVAYPMLEHLEWKEWVLYRIGVCEQRLGRYVDADSTFAHVQDLYPRSEAAYRAAAHQGMRGFYVQIGAFSKPADAAKAAAAISQFGSIARESSYHGLTIVCTEGVPTYAMAAAMRSQLIAMYPDARVRP